MRDPCADHPWSGPPSPVATSACSSSIDCAKTQKRAHPILECYVIFLGSKTPWCRQRDLHKREFPTRVSSPSNGAVTLNSGSNTRTLFLVWQVIVSTSVSPPGSRLSKTRRPSGGSPVAHPGSRRAEALQASAWHSVPQDIGCLPRLRLLSQPLGASCARHTFGGSDWHARCSDASIHTQCR